MKEIKLYDKVFLADVEIVVGRVNNNIHLGEVESVDVVTKDDKIFRKYRVFLENKKDFYTLIHETVHLVEKIFTDRGIAFTKENGELIAYYQTYWFKEIWRKINKK